MTAELAAAYERIEELEAVLDRVREAMDERHALGLPIDPMLDEIDTALSPMVQP